jgi:hypothetical protein
MPQSQGVCVRSVRFLSHSVFTLLLLAVLTAAGPSTAPATSPVQKHIPYIEPDLQAWIFHSSQLKAPADLRSRVARLLAIHVANDLSFEQPADIEQAARALGIALRLDEGSRPAVLANLSLRRGQPPALPPPKGWSQDQFVTELLRELTALSKSEHLADRTAAAYLCDLLLAIVPANEDVLFESEVLRQARIKTDWSWANPKRPGAVVAGTSPATQSAPVAQTNEPTSKQLLLVSRFDGHAQAVHNLHVLPDGITVISADSASVKQWPLTNGTLTRTFPVAGKQVVRTNTTRDGKLLYAVEQGDPAIETWDLGTGERVNKFPLARSSQFLVLSPDGKSALLAGITREPQPPQVMTFATGEVKDLPLKNVGTNWADVAVSPDGCLAYFSPAGRPSFLWDIKAEKVLREMGISNSVVAFSADSKKLARGEEASQTARGSMTIYESDNAERKLSLDIPPRMGASNPVFSPDGRFVLGLLKGEAQSARSSLAVWSADKGTLLAFYPLRNSIARLAISPDAKFVLAGASDGLIYVWQAPPEIDPRVSERIASNVDPEKTIERPEFANHVKPTARRQTSLRGLVIRQQGVGAQYGFATDIYFTMLPSPNPHEQFNNGNQVRFSRPVGRSMTAALIDAERAVRLRYPKWEVAQGQITFGDKTSPIDGSSAGTAFALLMLSSLEGFELDHSFAVTGDITVDWRVRRIGGVGAKLRGATVDKCRCVMIPEENASQLDDLLLSQGEKLFWDIQVFTAETLHDAVRMMRTDRAAQIEEAIEKFNRLQVRHQTDAAAYRTAAGITALQEILKLSPNHASARMLLALAQGKTPARLSATASLYEAFSASEGLRLILRKDPAAPIDDVAAKNLSVEQVLKRLAEIRAISRDEVHPMIDSLVDFSKAVDRLIKSSPRTPEREEAATNLRTQQDLVSRRLLEMQSNHDLMEQMLREGI